MQLVSEVMARSAERLRQGLAAARAGDPAQA